MELACELMKWPFRELMLGINEVLHGFSKSSMQLLVVNIINVRVLGAPIGYGPSSPGSPRTPSALVQGLRVSLGLAPRPGLTTAGGVQVSSPIFWMNLGHNGIAFFPALSPVPGGS